MLNKDSIKKINNNWQKILDNFRSSHGFVFVICISFPAVTYRDVYLPLFVFALRTSGYYSKISLVFIIILSLLLVVYCSLFHLLVNCPFLHFLWSPLIIYRLLISFRNSLLTLVWSIRTCCSEKSHFYGWFIVTIFYSRSE